MGGKRVSKFYSSVLLLTVLSLVSCVLEKLPWIFSSRVAVAYCSLAAWLILLGRGLLVVGVIASVEYFVLGRR